MTRRKRFDDLMEAVAFAEAGEHETARRLAREVFPEPAAVERILTVGSAQGFSRRMVENSLGLAERLGYGVVALTVAPGLARLLARLERGRRGPGAPVTPDAFRARAEERGVPFVHARRRGDAEQAVAEASRRFRRIAFVVVEPGLARKARFPGVDVPIYFLADA